MNVSIITPPVSDPVTLADAKAQCRVDGTDEDELIDGLIAAATAHVEAYTGRSIITQTLRLKTDAFTDEILLPRGPVQSVSSVTYYDANGNEQTASPTLYQLSENSVFRVPGASWPTTDEGKDRVSIIYVAGEAAPQPAVRHAILLLIGWWYDNRSAASSTAMKEVPHAVDALLANHRSYSF